MREIKFRGRAISDSCGEPVNKMVYGDITQGWDKVTIFDWNDGDCYEVEPESVAQLVGYDADGKEVYEGDKLKHVDDENYNAIARFETLIGVKTGTIQNLYDCHSEKIFHAQNSKFWKLKE